MKAEMFIPFLKTNMFKKKKTRIEKKREIIFSFSFSVQIVSKDCCKWTIQYLIHLIDSDFLIVEGSKKVKKKLNE